MTTSGASVAMALARRSAARDRKRRRALVAKRTERERLRREEAAQLARECLVVCNRALLTRDRALLCTPEQRRESGGDSGGKASVSIAMVID